MLFELAAIRDLEVGVDGAQPLRVLLHLDLILFAGHPDEGVEGISNGAGVLAITDIGIGPQRIQIPHLYHRRDKTLLDHGDLLCEGGFVEHVPPAGTGVGEHPGGHDGHAVGLGVVAAHQVGADLGDGIGGGGVEGTVLVDAIGRFYLRGDLAKHLGGGADMDGGLASGDAEGLQQVAGTDDVGVQGVDRGVKAGLGVALGRQVKDIVRLDLLDGGEKGDQIVKVGIPEVDTVLMIGPLEKVLDIVDGAPPAADAVDIPVGVF